VTVARRAPAGGKWAVRGPDAVLQTRRQDEIMSAKLIAANVPASDTAKVGKFYRALLGLEPARSFTEQTKSYHIPLSNDGHFLWISERTAEDEQICSVFAVDDLQQTKSELVAAGGRVFVDNIDAPISPRLMKAYRANNTSKAAVTPTAGKMALVRDPENNVIAVIQLEPHLAPYYHATDVKSFLSPAVLAAHRQVLKEGALLDSP
jgi:predicted enzyme related to lactoylglutathione lyase